MQTPPTNPGFDWSTCFKQYNAKSAPKSTATTEFMKYHSLY
jgi:hypothetical protein